jgi:hemoglobin/transferrin/lactoferrin receptor protein
MKKIIIILNILIVNTLCAQTQDTLKENALQEVIISASKSSENKARVAQMVEVISAKRISQINAASTAELLAADGKVLVQKSQQGGGSPMLRGFEASRVLLVVDGVRMNNLIYRAGHLQNAITVDQNMLERAEVLFGTASTVYGSDALGGVVHFYTKKPQFDTTLGNILLRYGSVNQEKTAHVDFNLGYKKFAYITSFTYSKFEDLTMGKNTQALDTLWGLRNFYAGSIYDKDNLFVKDTVLKNDNPYLQKYSGYYQIDVLQKFLYQPTPSVSHALNVQFSNSSSIPRYDRLTDVDAKGKLNQARWYYGPQGRTLLSYQLKINDLDIGLNYQEIEESRITRGFNNAFLTTRLEKVSVLGWDADYDFEYKNHAFRTGFEGQYGSVNSFASRNNVVTGENNLKASTRYPDGINFQINNSIYATHKYAISEKWLLNDGIRLTNTTQKSTFKDKTFFPFPFDEAVQNVTAFAGNIGLIFRPNDYLKLAALASSGFRVPNVDDLTKIFDSQKGSVIVPNPNIQPERTYNFEFNPTIKFGSNWTWENSFYLTFFNNAIIVDKFNFNGQDSVVYDGVKSAVLANQNKKRAQIMGVQSVLKGQIMDGLTLMASYNFTRGRVLNDEGKETPLDHIPPVYGRFGLNYDKNKINAEILTLFNGRKNILDYLLNGEDNEQYAVKNYGMPAWWTLNLRFGFSLVKGGKIQVGVDNIMDVNYRVFASGIHAGGRNVYAALRYGF